MFVQGTDPTLYPQPKSPTDNASSLPESSDDIDRWYNPFPGFPRHKNPRPTQDLYKDDGISSRAKPYNAPVPTNQMHQSAFAKRAPTRRFVKIRMKRSFPSLWSEYNRVHQPCSGNMVVLPPMSIIRERK